LAAAIISRSGWLNDPTKPLLDPFCGPGTLLIEAVMMANNMAPGLWRQQFAFERGLNFDQAGFEEQLIAARDLESPVAGLNVLGCDINSRLMNTAQANARLAELNHLIKFVKADATTLKKSQSDEGFIVSNPPYGERMGEMAEMQQLYAAFGTVVKQQFCGCKLALFTQDVAPINQ
jgi:23S rRNA (guanine2445-N2)-methyltransferase / 23S rRNA (guanine2069-N7)-methyltransferase